MELKNIFKDHEFFKDLEKNSGEDAVIKCFKTMKHVVYGFQDEIFKYGDTAYYFYLILKGSVGIKVPSPVEITWSYNEYIQFLADNYRIRSCLVPPKRPTFIKIHEGTKQRWFLFFQNFQKSPNFFTKSATGGYFDDYGIIFK